MARAFSCGATAFLAWWMGFSCPPRLSRRWGSTIIGTKTYVRLRQAGYKVVGVWKEIASGAKQERAERKKVLALAQARKVDVILVTELTGSARFAARSLTCFKFRFVSSPPYTKKAFLPSQE